MNKKIIYTRLLLLTLFLSLVGCTADLEVIKKDAINSEQLITLHKNFEFVKLNKSISKIIITSEKAKSSTLNSKIIQTKDFKIFTNRVTYTTLKNKSRESYSFYIERNNSLKSDIIENLILAKNATNDNYRAYIITYFFPDGINSNHNNFKVKAFQEINSQTLSIKNIFAKTDCQDSYKYKIIETRHKCYSGEHYGAGEVGDCDGKGGLPYSTYSIQVLTVSCNTSEGGGTYNPDPTSGTGTTGPTSPNTGNTLPVDTGMTFPYPCQTDDCSEMLIVNEINDLLDNSLDYIQLEWLAMNNDSANEIKISLVQNNTTEAKAFAIEVINYCIANPAVTYKEIFYNRTSLDTNASIDLDNNVNGGYDSNYVADFIPQQIWTTISQVIPTSQFVGWGSPGIKRNCMDYAKAQIAKNGYQISNYGSAGQTFQIYSEQNGVNQENLRKGISYLKYALSNNIPVIVGVDDNPGHPGNLDNSTDHFVVIVGMGSNNYGNYFQFYDNASGTTSQGTSPLNLLYYNSSTGKISGKSQCSGYFNYVAHDYIITQIRKSKTKL